MKFVVTRLVGFVALAASLSVACTGGSKGEREGSTSTASAKKVAPLSEVEVASREQTLRAMYADVLARPPKDDEVARWKDAWHKGGSLVDTARSLLASEEQRTLLLAGYHKKFLRRRAPVIGRDLLGDKELEAGHPNAVLATLLAGDEFSSFYGHDDRATIQGMTKALLGRAPKAAEIETALGTIAATESRHEAVRNVLASEEYLADQLVRGWYQKYLHRAPLPTVRAEALEKLRAGESHWELQAKILGSADYVAFHSCTKTTCSAGGKNCGVLSDGCGGLLDCGECDLGLECGAETANVCGVKCVPMTCLERLAECGTIDDGCGGTLDCGSCRAGRACGTDALANTCVGEGACRPRTCAELGTTHGRQLDGCGGMIDCGPEPIAELSP
ncbi:MAG: hypothetical protein U0169_23425 [Polyangiaceae bacterium]